MRSYICFFLGFIAYGLTAQKTAFPALSLDGALTDNANAVVRLDETRIDLSSPKSLKHTHKRVVTVLNKKGDLYLDLRVFYDNKISIKNLGAVVYNSLGQEVQKFKSGDFKDVAAVSSFSIYEDSRIKYLEYTPTAYPCTVAFYYETTTANTAWIPFWRPLKGYNISTEKSTYDVVYDVSVGMDKKEKNFAGHPITDRSTTPGHLSFAAENLAAINPEELSPDFEEFSPMLMVAPKNFYYEGYTGNAGDWESLGQWKYDHLLANRTQLPEETKQRVKHLVAGIEDPIEKARRIYAYVQDNTRYISVQVGIGGIQPITASEVDRVKYGDCKGLTNYTMALLEVAGVRSNYTEVYANAKGQRSIDKEFPTLLGQVNHVILNIPIENGEPIWLECTSQTMPFGFLGDFTDDREVLSITPEGGKVIRTPKYPASTNSQVTTGVFEILPDKGLVARAKIVSKGIQYDDKFHVEREEKRNQDKYYKNRWGYIGNMRLGDMKFQNDREQVMFAEEVSFDAVDYAALSGDLLLFSPNILNRNEYVPNRYRNRKLPLKIARGFVDEDGYEIKLPEGFVVESIPENISLDNKFGKYKVGIERISETLLRYTRTFVVLEGLYAQEEYPAYREFMREVARHDNAKIVLIKK